MNVSLVLEPKGSTTNLFVIDVKEFYGGEWASDSPRMKVTHLQHICQQEQRLWCALTSYRTNPVPQLELAMRRMNRTMRENGQLSPDKPDYEASSNNRYPRGYLKTKTVHMIQANTIITVRGVGQNIGTILAKHMEDLGASVVLAPTVSPGGEAKANAERSAASRENQAKQEFLFFVYFAQEPHRRFHYKETKQSIVSVMMYWKSKDGNPVV